MSETSSQHSGRLSEPRIMLLAGHAVQFVLAIVILGLDAYGIHYVAYTGLVCSLALCTILTCAYLIVSQSVFRHLHRSRIAIAYHVVMLIFWIVDLGLIMKVAKLWEGPACTYSYRNGYECAQYDKRDAGRTHTTRYKTFYRALVAGAVLAAFEFTLWMLTSILMLTRGYSKELRDPLRHQPHATRSNRMPMSQLREPPSVQDRTAVAPWENQPGPPVLSARSFIIPDIEDDLAPPPHGDETFVPSRGSMRTHVVARGSLMGRRSTGSGRLSEGRRLSSISFVSNLSTRSMSFMSDARTKRQSVREHCEE